MTKKSLADVRVRLEKSFNELAKESATSKEKYELYEYLAIQILDSEFDDFEEGELEEFLADFLGSKNQ